MSKRSRRVVLSLKRCHVEGLEGTASDVGVHAPTGLVDYCLVQWLIIDRCCLTPEDDYRDANTGSRLRKLSGTCRAIGSRRWR